jgi:hypothetical protein
MPALTRTHLAIALVLGLALTRLRPWGCALVSGLALSMLLRGSHTCIWFIIGALLGGLWGLVTTGRRIVDQVVRGDAAPID